MGVYKFTEEISSGANEILKKYKIPYIPMIHCFLVYNTLHFDLTEGNKIGKKKPIENRSFIHIEEVEPFISRKDEYLLFKKVVKEKILFSSEMEGINDIIKGKGRKYYSLKKEC